ncbi:MAG: 1-deoxy-D-xylulose-5-phosphate reductoisomerase [Thermodesulfovibrionia bacterium]
MMKRLSILGSSGSIGRSTLEVVKMYPERFKVVALAVRDNIDLLKEQIDVYKPEVVAIFDESAGERLRMEMPGVEVLVGMDGLITVATIESADMVVSAIVGSAGLIPTFSAVMAGKNIALANKEALVMAGHLIIPEARKRGAMILPVDSEHSALFQCLENRNSAEIRRIILTASGGPFLRKTKEELNHVTPEEALRHPRWKMGKKVTIDSSTLMNKGLEVIEAHWLFDMPSERIDVLLHPQSVVHSLVELIDGSLLAHMSVPDMKGPICYALSYPDRCDGVLHRLDLAKTHELIFEEPDPERYPCLMLTYEALRCGGTMPSVLNASNEIAVKGFLNREIPFTAIPHVVSDVMSAHEPSKGETIEEIISASMWAEEKAKELIRQDYRKER